MIWASALKSKHFKIMLLASQAFDGATFGILAVSFDVKIANVLILRIFFRAKRSPTPTSPKLPVRLCLFADTNNQVFKSSVGGAQIGEVLVDSV